MTVKLLTGLLLSLTLCTVSRANKSFKIPLTKHAITNGGELVEVNSDDPMPQRGSPRVGGWAEAEMWNGKVKEPLDGVGNFIFTGDVQFGTPLQKMGKCIFDSSTEKIMAFAKGCQDCRYFTPHQYDKYNSTTYELIVPSQKFTSQDGFSYTGDYIKDTVCLGNGDVHTTVCLDDHRFFAVNTLSYDSWFKVLHNHAVVEAIFGLGFA